MDMVTITHGDIAMAGIGDGVLMVDFMIQTGTLLFMGTGMATMVVFIAHIIMAINPIITMVIMDIITEIILPIIQVVVEVMYTILVEVAVQTGTATFETLLREEVHPHLLEIPIHPVIIHQTV